MKKVFLLAIALFTTSLFYNCDDSQDIQEEQALTEKSVSVDGQKSKVKRPGSGN